jgi:hypothetical protein
MTTETELQAVAKDVVALMTKLQCEPPAGGSLTVVGTGIRAIRQLTVESIAIMADAEVLLHVIGEPIQEEALAEINPRAETMTGFYVEGMDRGATYEAMIQRLLSSVQDGKRTVAAFYGHSGVFTYPTHEAIRRVRAAGYPARMLPAVSAADCLYADLGIDPGDGSQAYEATDFLYGQHPIDTSAHLFLWQVGAIGNTTYETTNYDMSLFPQFMRKMLYFYPPFHPAVLYEASFDPKGIHRADRLPLAQLRPEMTTLATLLAIPPIPAWARSAAPRKF